MKPSELRQGSTLGLHDDYKLSISYNKVNEEVYTLDGEVIAKKDIPVEDLDKVVTTKWDLAASDGQAFASANDLDGELIISITKEDNEVFRLVTNNQFVANTLVEAYKQIS